MKNETLLTAEARRRRGGNLKLFLLGVSASLRLLALAQSTNKTFMLNTGNALPPSVSNFFVVNSNLLNQAVSPNSVAGVSSVNGQNGAITGVVTNNDSSSVTLAASLQVATNGAFGGAVTASNLYADKTPNNSAVIWNNQGGGNISSAAPAILQTPYVPDIPFFTSGCLTNLDQGGVVTAGDSQLSGYSFYNNKHYCVFNTNLVVYTNDINWSNGVPVVLQNITLKSFFPNTWPNSVGAIMAGGKVNPLDGHWYVCYTFFTNAPSDYFHCGSNIVFVLNSTNLAYITQYAVKQEPNAIQDLDFLPNGQGIVQFEGTNYFAGQQLHYYSTNTWLLASNQAMDCGVFYANGIGWNPWDSRFYMIGAPLSPLPTALLTQTPGSEKSVLYKCDGLGHVTEIACLTNSSPSANGGYGGLWCDPMTNMARYTVNYDAGAGATNTITYLPLAPSASAFSVWGDGIAQANNLYAAQYRISGPADQYNASTFLEQVSNGLPQIVAANGLTLDRFGQTPWSCDFYFDVLDSSSLAGLHAVNNVFCGKGIYANGGFLTNMYFWGQQIYTNAGSLTPQYLISGLTGATYSPQYYFGGVSQWAEEMGSSYLIWNSMYPTANIGVLGLVNGANPVVQAIAPLQIESGAIVSGGKLTNNSLTASALIMTGGSDQEESVILGTGLSLSGSTLNASGGSATEYFNQSQFQTNAASQITLLPGGNQTNQNLYNVNIVSGYAATLAITNLNVSSNSYIGKTNFANYAEVSNSVIWLADGIQAQDAGGNLSLWNPTSGLFEFGFSAGSVNGTVETGQFVGTYTNAAQNAGIDANGLGTLSNLTVVASGTVDSNLTVKGIVSAQTNVMISRTNFANYVTVTNRVNFLSDGQQIGDSGGTLAFYNPTSTEFNFGGSAFGASDGTINAIIPVGDLNGGTGASGTTYWRGDGTWGTPSGGGGIATLNGIGTNTFLTNATTSGMTNTNMVMLSGSIAASVMPSALVFSPFNGWKTGHIHYSAFSSGFNYMTDGCDCSPWGNTYATHNNYPDGTYVNFTTTASSGNTSGFGFNNYAFVNNSGSFYWIYHFALSGTASERVWIGESAGSGTAEAGSDTCNGDKVDAFRYSTAAGDTKWIAYSYNGTTTTTYTTTVAPDTSWHTAMGLMTSSSCIFYMDGIPVATNANVIPASTTFMDLFGVATLTTAATTLSFNDFDYAQSGP